MFTLDHDTLFAAKNQTARDAAPAFKGFISVESYIIILALKLQNHELFTKINTRRGNPPLMEKKPDEDGGFAALLKDLIISEASKVT